MSSSLKQLKELLMAKGGYNITPAHNQLNDLKALVTNMMSVRSAAAPGSGAGSYSGTKCTGHIANSNYKLSVGDIAAVDIKGCSCNTVKDTTGYCPSRTNVCACNANNLACQCNGRTMACDCQSVAAGGNSCGNYDWDDDYYNCYCNNVGTYNGRACGCYYVYRNNPFSQLPTTYNDYCRCNARGEALCGSRTASCGSRNTVTCQCNGRCACNAESRFN